MIGRKTRTERLRAVVRGRVQGVGFRYSVLELAQRHGLRGFTQNRPDGSVLVVAEGRPGQLDELEKFLHIGPKLARVSGVDAERLAASDEFDHFVAR